MDKPLTAVARRLMNWSERIDANVRFWPKADVQKILFLEFAYALQLTR